MTQNTFPVMKARIEPSVTRGRFRQLVAVLSPQETEQSHAKAQRREEGLLNTPLCVFAAWREISGVLANQSRLGVSASAN
jgi:hypothetical protein